VTNDKRLLSVISKLKEKLSTTPNEHLTTEKYHAQKQKFCFADSLSMSLN